MKTKMEDLPEDVQEEITNLRRQKGNALDGLKETRTKYEEAMALVTEANEKLSKMDTLQADHEKLLTEVEGSKLSVLKYDTAWDKGLPKSFAKLLQGSTPDELAAHADQILADMPSGGETRRPSFVDTTQGTGATSGGRTVEPLNSGNFAEDLAAALADTSGDGE